MPDLNEQQRLLFTLDSYLSSELQKASIHFLITHRLSLQVKHLTQLFSLTYFLLFPFRHIFIKRTSLEHVMKLLTLFQFLVCIPYFLKDVIDHGASLFSISYYQLLDFVDLLSIIYRFSYRLKSLNTRTGVFLKILIIKSIFCVLRYSLREELLCQKGDYKVIFIRIHQSLFNGLLEFNYLVYAEDLIYTNQIILITYSGQTHQLVAFLFRIYPLERHLVLMAHHLLSSKLLL